MKTSKEKVLDWIEENFHDVSLEDYPILPGGTIIKDRYGGEMLVFFDALTDEIKYFIGFVGEVKR